MLGIDQLEIDISSIRVVLMFTFFQVSQDADMILQLWKGGKLSEDLQENMKTLTEHEAVDDKNDSLETSDDNDDINNTVTSSSCSKIPVISSSDMNYIVMMNATTEKHKNKIKKHCNLM